MAINNDDTGFKYFIIYPPIIPINCHCHFCRIYRLLVDFAYDFACFFAVLMGIKIGGSKVHPGRPKTGSAGWQHVH